MFEKVTYIWGKRWVRDSRSYLGSKTENDVDRKVKLSFSETLLKTNFETCFKAESHCNMEREKQNDVMQHTIVRDPLKLFSL